MNLALHPHLVDMDKAVDEEVHEQFLLGKGVTLPLDTLDYTSSGVFEVENSFCRKGQEGF